MAGVKSRLQLFEPPKEEAAQENSPGMNSFGRNQMGMPTSQGGLQKNVPPALQKFLQKQNESITSTEKHTENKAVLLTKSQDRMTPVPVPVAPKWGKPPADTTTTDNSKKEEQDENKNVLANDVIKRNGSVGTGSADKRVSVPKIFQQEPTEPTANGKPAVNLKPGKLNPSLLPKTSPKPTVPGAKPVPLVKKPPLTSKPSPVNKPENTIGAVGIKLPSVDSKPLAGKTDSTTSSTSATSQSSTTSSTTSPHNPPSPDTKDEADSGVIDFRSRLRPTKRLSETGDAKPAAVSLRTAIKPPVEGKPEEKDSGTPANDNKSSTGIQSSKSFKESKRRSSGHIIERLTDKKKFKKLKLDEKSTTEPPAKPEVPQNLDLSVIRKQYQSAISAQKEESDALNKAADEVDDDDIYDDGFSVNNVLPRRSTFKRTSQRISYIPEITSEEEEEDLVYDEGFTPASPPFVPTPVADEVYVDAETERKQTEEDDGDADSLYEDEETFMQRYNQETETKETEEEKKKRQKEEAEAKKREEKEKREKEKEEEKKRKKEEKEKKEEMKLRKKFNLTGDEHVGEGVMKQDVKTAKFGGLALKKGQIVTIVRLDNNPPNKWLIKADSGMDFVDSSNIEVEPSIIKKAMSTIKKANDEQPMYDDVADSGGAAKIDEYEDGDIYEECQ